MFKLEFTNQAKKRLAKLKKSEPAAFNKAEILISELQEHPRTDTGKPEQLKHSYCGMWSR